MNILHLHTNLNLTCGISKTIYLIAKYPAESCQHFIISLGGDAEKKFSDAGIKVTYLSDHQISRKCLLKILLFLKHFIKENKIDIVHSHHRYFDFVSYALSFFCKLKRVTSVQSLVYGKKLISYKSPVLLAAGESVKKHLIDYFKIRKERIIVFNNFIDINEVPQNVNMELIKENLNIPMGAYLIGYVGRFSIKEKGIDILIKAFEKFNASYKNSYLIMAGDGDDIKKINIPENVIIIKAKKNIFEFYKIFDCLVLPSRIDPFPLTVLEAGMMKIPFIGSDVNGISEIIEDNIDGLLFEKGNENMLIEKLELFYKEKEFASKCAGNLYQKVLKKYNHKKAVELLNKIYEEL